MRATEAEERTLGDMHFDSVRRYLSGPAGRARLEPKAAAVLDRLMDHCGRIVSRESVLDSVWRGRVVTDATVTVAVGQVRRALKLAGVRRVTIETVAGHGYGLRVDNSTADVSRVSWFTRVRPLLMAALVLMLPAGEALTGDEVLLDMTLTRSTGEEVPIRVVVARASDAAVRTENGEQALELTFGVDELAPRHVRLRITSSTGSTPMMFRLPAVFGGVVELRVPAGGNERVELRVTPRRISNAFRHGMRRESSRL